MEENYGIRRFPYPAYGAQLAMAQVDPNTRRLILPTPNRLRGSAPAFVPGQTQYDNPGPRAQYPASLTPQHMSRNHQTEPLKGNGRPCNYYQLPQQLLRRGPVVGVDATPGSQTLNTPNSSVPEPGLGLDLLQQEHDQRNLAPDASTTPTPESGETHEQQIQDIETNLLQAFAVSNDAAAPHQTANEMLASRAFAAPSLPMGLSGVQTDQSITEQPPSNEGSWATSNSQGVICTAMQQGFPITSRNTGSNRFLVSPDNGADNEANLDPALRRTQQLQGVLSHGIALQASSGETYRSASVSNGSGANFGQPQQNLGGHQPQTKPNLTINTRINLTRAQEIEFAKEKIAHRPSQPLPTDRFTVDQHVGRPPSVLRERIPKPQEDTRHWFSEFTANELLHHMHPDDMCGTIIVEIAKQYSGAEIADFANELYKLRGGAKGDISTNGFTKRITLAVKHLCRDVKADRQRVLDALADDRSIYRETGTPGTKAEMIIQSIRGRKAAQASSAVMRAPAVQVVQPSYQAAASAPPTLPTFAASLAQNANDSGLDPTAMRSTEGHSKRKRSDQTGEAQQPKRAKHDESDLGGEGSDEDAEFEYE